MKNFRILVDLDGVLGDFVGAALHVHGIPRSVWEAAQPRGTWDMTVGLGITHNQFWRPINRLGSRFWTSIPLLPWAKQLLAVVNQHTDDWLIATTPSLSVSSYVGKIHWLRQQFGQGFKRFELITDKRLLANSNTVLIDDNENNCLQFTKAGGHVILFPSRLNSLYKLSPAEAMNHVISRLNNFSNSFKKEKQCT